VLLLFLCSMILSSFSTCLLPSVELSNSLALLLCAHALLSVPSHLSSLSCSCSCSCCLFFVLFFQGTACSFRHSEEAKSNPRNCHHWLAGHCPFPRCTFRHPTVPKVRRFFLLFCFSCLLFSLSYLSCSRTKFAHSRTPTPTLFSCLLRHRQYTANPHVAPGGDPSSTICYFVTQPSGCAKGDHCPFLHPARRTTPVGANPSSVFSLPQLVGTERAPAHTTNRKPSAAQAAPNSSTPTPGFDAHANTQSESPSSASPVLVCFAYSHSLVHSLWTVWRSC
jgi:hypothetical protein